MGTMRVSYPNTGYDFAIIIYTITIYILSLIEREMVSNHGLGANSWNEDFVCTISAKCFNIQFVSVSLGCVTNICFRYV